MGRYVKDNGGKISAFYLSNVEQFLQQDGIWDDFCRNVSRACRWMLGRRSSDPFAADNTG